MIVGVLALALGITLIYLGVKGISLRQFLGSLTSGQGTPPGGGENVH